MEFSARWEQALLGGVMVVEAQGLRLAEEEHALYQAAAPLRQVPVPLRWVPYYAWNNRGVGEMMVWIHAQQ